ncbi:MAG: Lrp/AsnC family transcriptional regulator [bacterium]|nr:Lrp/AsnC family transcriptional regulator [bacterium]
MRTPNPLRIGALIFDLDRIDRRILARLQKDARITNKELAAEVGLAPSTCHARVQRLEGEGIVRGFHADVDPAALGIGLQAIVSVQLTGNPKRRLDAFLAHVSSLDEVVHVYQVAGRNDLLLHVCVHDVQHMRELVMNQLSSRPEAQQIESAIVYEHTRAECLPDLNPDESVIGR